jgi:hypothetical protein
MPEENSNLFVFFTMSYETPLLISRGFTEPDGALSLAQ